MSSEKPEDPLPKPAPWWAGLLVFASVGAFGALLTLLLYFVVMV